MRWHRLVPFAVLLTLVGSVAGSSAAAGSGATRSVLWVGTSDQGLPLRFHVVRDNGGAKIADQALILRTTCPSGAVSELGVRFHGFPAQIQDNAFRFEFFTGDFYLKWTGTFDSPIHVSGSVFEVIPQLNHDIQAETCPSGRAHWEAHPASSASGDPTVGSAPTTQITFTRDAAGTVHRTVEG